MKSRFHLRNHLTLGTSVTNQAPSFGFRTQCASVSRCVAKFWKTQTFARHYLCPVDLGPGRGTMNQGPFYESGTMTASVTKSEEEAEEPEKHVSNWVSQVSVGPA